MLAGHLTLSSGKVSLSLVPGKVFFGEQSLKPSNLTLYLSAASLCSSDSWVRSPTLFSRGATFSRAS